MINSKFKKILSVFTISSMLMQILFSGNGLLNAEAADNNMFGIKSNALTVSAADVLSGSMDISAYSGKWKYHDTVTFIPQGETAEKTVSITPCYELDDVSYCSNPTNPTVEIMNIFVPAAYMQDNGDGTFSINRTGTFTASTGNGDTVTYNAETAPIMYYNSVNGYSEAPVFGLTGSAGNGSGSCIYEVMAQGCVAVSAGARGKETTAEDGTYTGKVPSGLIDLKAGIRFLKYNDAVLAGDSNKIVSVGVSAGGAMSALLGATGNSPLYSDLLNEIGAADTTDNIYSAVCYCPITNLDNADGAYEWLHHANTAYTTWGGDSGELSDFQKSLSDGLYNSFVNYVQSLGYDLGSDGRSGSFYSGFVSAYEDALNVYLDSKTDDSSEKQNILKQLDPDGAFSVWDDADNKAKITGLDDYANSNLSRAKLPPAFDSLDYSSNEAAAFGNAATDKAHFSTSVMDVLKSLSDQTDAEPYYESYAADIDDSMLQRMYLMNPMNFIGTDETCDLAPYWRVNVGSKDGDEATVAAYTMVQALRNHTDKSVSYQVIWGQGHAAVEYNFQDVMDYVHQICR